MADNFLEKRMADYREGRLAAVRSGRASVAKDALAIHVDGSECSELVKALRRYGAKVSFSGLAGKAGAELAQQSGSTFCPMVMSAAVEHMMNVRGKLDAVVLTNDCTDNLPSALTTISYSRREGTCTHSIPGSLPADEAAPLILALAKVCTPLRIEVKSVGK